MMSAMRTAAARPARMLRTAPLLGPAFVAAIAYVDPGNFATNFAAGSEYGYLLLWVIVAANITAMLIQSLSAKLGLATGRNLPEVCRDTFPRRVNIGLWVQAEFVAIATDLAEVIGGAVALYLLFGLPLPIGGLVTGVVAFGLLALQERGHRPFERAVAGLFAVIVVGFVVTLLRVPVEVGPLAAGLVPAFAGSESLLLAAGILGATVMPHVIYLHSALTSRRDPRHTAKQRHRLLRRAPARRAGGDGVGRRWSTRPCSWSRRRCSTGPRSRTRTRSRACTPAWPGPSTPRRRRMFALALLASGFASSGVGTYAGQVVMQGFVQRRIPLLARRALTLAPALWCSRWASTRPRPLVFSQVVLAFGIPFALVPLVLLTRRRGLMGELVNRRLTTAVASLAAPVIIALNAVLLWHTFA